jgi:hypothetical protein
MNKTIKRRLISLLLILLSGAFYAYTVTNRTFVGYFNSGKWILLDGIAWILFFGIVSGTVITELIKRTK